MLAVGSCDATAAGPALARQRSRMDWRGEGRRADVKGQRRGASEPQNHNGMEVTWHGSPEARAHR